MDTIYLKIKIKKPDSQAEELRNEGLFFSSIAEVLNVSNDAIIEIDETNYKQNVSYIIKKMSKYDKNRRNKKSFRRP